MMIYAYADPPYLGCCKLYDHDHGDDGLCWDDIATHENLIDHLLRNYDGWALSMASVNLVEMLPLLPCGIRVAAWVKPFASFKPGVNPAYAWEPVVFYNPRVRTGRTEPTVRDWCAEPIMVQKGLTGAKPEAFCQWVASFLGVRDEDELIDLFPGTGIMGRALAQGRLL